MLGLEKIGPEHKNLLLGQMSLLLLDGNVSGYSVQVRSKGSLVGSGGNLYSHAVGQFVTTLAKARIEDTKSKDLLRHRICSLSSNAGRSRIVDAARSIAVGLTAVIQVNTTKIITVQFGSAPQLQGHLPAGRAWKALETNSL